MINKFDYHYPPEGLDEYIHNKTNILARYKDAIKGYHQLFYQEFNKYFILVYLTGNHSLFVEVLGAKHNSTFYKIQVFSKYIPLENVSEWETHILNIFSAFNLAGDKMINKTINIIYQNGVTEDYKLEYEDINDRDKINHIINVIHHNAINQKEYIDALTGER